MFQPLYAVCIWRSVFNFLTKDSLVNRTWWRVFRQLLICRVLTIDVQAFVKRVAFCLSATSCLCLCHVLRTWNEPFWSAANYVRHRQLTKCSPRAIKGDFLDVVLCFVAKRRIIPRKVKWNVWNPLISSGQPEGFQSQLVVSGHLARLRCSCSFICLDGHVSKSCQNFQQAAQRTTSIFKKKKIK